MARTSGGRLAFSRAIAKSVWAWRPEVVLAQYAALPAAVAACRAAHVPVLAVVHDYYGLSDSIRVRGPATGLARSLALEQWMRVLPPDGFIVPSRVTQSRLSTLAGGRPITVVPAGADHLPVGIDEPRRVTQVLFVGRLVPSKGVADLIDAVALIRSSGVRCDLVVVGTGPEAESLATRAEPLGDGVRFLGSLDDASLEREIRRSLALVLPSRREGWGLAVTEAASRGTAYVAYDVPAVREQHELLKGGLLVCPGADGLAKAIARLLEDRPLASELGRRGRAAAGTMRWATAALVVENAATAIIARAGSVGH